MMVYNTSKYSVSGLCPSFDILKNTKEYNASETASVSILRLRDLLSDEQKKSC
jgi:hypothetical protein